MKKVTKVFLTAALCCILGGILIVGICSVSAIAGGVSLVDQLPDRLRYSGSHQDGTAVDGDGAQKAELGSISSLSLNLIEEDIVIKTGGDRVVIEWTQEYKGQYILSADEGGRLSLSREQLNFGFGFWRNGLFFNVNGLLRLIDGTLWSHLPQNRVVTVTLPEGMRLDSVNIGNVSGNISMTDITADNFKLGTVSGSLTAVSCAFDNTELGGVSGDSALRECALRDVVMSTVSGSLDIKAGRLRTVSLEGVNARLLLFRADGLESARVSGVNAEGDITLTGPTSNYRMEADGLNCELTADGVRSRGVRNEGAPYKLYVSGVNAHLRVQSGG